MKDTGFERNGFPTAVLDVREGAAYLAVTDVTLRRMIRRGEIPHTRVGRSIRLRLVDLDAYLEERTSRKWVKVDDRGRPSKEAETG